VPYRYTAARDDPFSGTSLRLRIVVTAAVFASFAISSFVRYPIPGPNEPHYLCKAKHYWDPAWCARDFFLESSNAHLIFFQTFGLLTRWLSLDATAVIGRLLGLLIFATGWTLLVHTLVPARWPPLWAAWIYLLIAAYAGNLSGEWLIGGIEAKVIAYGLLFAAMACCTQAISTRNQGSLLVAGVLIGIAISFHPVVGIWGAACGVFATLGVFLLGTRSSQTTSRRLSWRSILAACATAGLLGIPGIVAGLRATKGSSFEADYIQVYYRLAHHLDPLHFATTAWSVYAVLALTWLAGRWFMARRVEESWFAWFVVGSALIAACGLLVGWRHGPPENIKNYSFPWLIEVSLRWKILKLYPFRLVDAMLPIAVALTAAGLLRRGCEFACRWPGIARKAGVVGLWLACGLPVLTTLHLADDARPTFDSDELADWYDVCRWTREHTPQDKLILAPVQESWAFKWYAQRPEFVSFKDCPQDGPGIIEWNERLLFLRNWSEASLPDGYSRAEVEVLRKRGIAYIIARRLGPFNFDPVYANDTFRVYQLTP
jgi:hypothetical protein